MANSSDVVLHVKDCTYFHFPNGTEHGLIVPIPQPYDIARDWLGIQHPPIWLHDWQITKFMVTELVVAVLMLTVFLILARRIAKGGPPKGRFWNLFETLLVFTRDKIARPAMGKRDADRFLPYIWTVFFFILFCNLVSLLPWMGSPTGALGCTGALAIIAFVVCIGAGIQRFGAIGYLFNQVPDMELPLVLAVFLKPMILAIEMFGLIIKHFVLAVRLLANMFAGHLVLAVMVGFIVQSAGLLVWYGVMPASIFGAVALNLLELFVAFLQAYIFTFLSALFIGMAIHKH
ncbi:MAG: F0F1 ATP synthase subunit A [Pirellulaceae bacterium]|nr:F0F1 ATP synthase subunit A [Pirellulaceae bacterium]